MNSITATAPLEQARSISSATAPATSGQASGAARRRLAERQLMTSSIRTPIRSADRYPAQSQPVRLSVVRALSRSWIMLKTLMKRSRLRGAPGDMDDRLLRDIGATRILAQREVERRREHAQLFWLL
jgi:uncharacterized protein YjiS (DUF1127 family)